MQTVHLIYLLLNGLIVATIPAFAIEQALKIQSYAASISDAQKDSQPDSLAEFHA